MPGRIKKREPSHAIRKDQLSVLNGNTLEPLGRVHIRNTRQFPGLNVVLFGLEFGAGPLLLVNLVELLEDITG